MAATFIYKTFRPQVVFILRIKVKIFFFYCVTSRLSFYCSLIHLVSFLPPYVSKVKVVIFLLTSKYIGLSLNISISYRFNGNGRSPSFQDNLGIFKIFIFNETSKIKSKSLIISPIFQHI